MEKSNERGISVIVLLTAALELPISHNHRSVFKILIIVPSYSASFRLYVQIARFVYNILTLQEISFVRISIEEKEILLSKLFAAKEKRSFETFRSSKLMKTRGKEVELAGFNRVTRVTRAFSPCSRATRDPLAAGCQRGRRRLLLRQPRNCRHVANRPASLRFSPPLFPLLFLSSHLDRSRFFPLSWARR